MNIKRWENAISILEKVKEKNFDYNSIARDVTPLKAPRPDMDDYEEVKVKCRTVGCAIGWIASDEGVMKSGLHLKAEVRELDQKNVWACPTYRGLESQAAVAKYFDIDEYLCENIFFSGWSARQLFEMDEDEKVKLKHIIGVMKFHLEKEKIKRKYA